MKTRTLYFDILRILSCVMIVFMHAQKAGVGTPGWVLSGASYLEAAGIGLFFMISGALILRGKIADGQGNAALSDKRQSVGAFLWHRLKKICIPLLCWYVVYSYTQSIGLESSGLGVLWFLWTMCGLYLLSPILIRWLQHAGDKEILAYLGVWGISLLYPVVGLFLPVAVSDTSWIYYFHGYVGYFVLGYYLSDRVKHLSAVFKGTLCILFFLVSLCAPLLVLFMGIEIDFYTFFWYLSLPVVLQCVAWFLCLKRLEPCLQSMPEKGKNIIQWVSSQTFGIYLMHILIMRGWLWQTEWMQSLHSVTHMAVSAIFTFFLAMIITAVLRKVPYLRGMVGERFLMSD